MDVFASLYNAFLFSLIFLSYCVCVYFRRLFFLFSAEIEDELKFSNTDYGTLISVSTLCYAFGKLILGSLNDVIRPGTLLACSVLAISLSVLSLANISTFNQAIFWVSFNMFVQGGAWIAAVKLVRLHFSTDYFPTLFCIMGCSNNFAGFLAPLTLFSPWREAVTVYGKWVRSLRQMYLGTYGMIFTTMLFLNLAFRADHHHHSNEKSKPEPGPKGSVLGLVLCDRAVWIVSILLLFAVEMRTLAENWTPIFIKDTSATPDADLKLFLTLFDIGGVVGSLGSGLLVQRLYSIMNKDSARVNVGMAATALSLVSAAFLFVNVSSVATFGFLVGLFVYASINVWGMVSAEMAPHSITGTVNAVVSFICNGSSLIAGRPVAILVDSVGFPGLFPFILGHLIVPVLLYYPCRSSRLLVAV